jgi:hypothetical protein
MVGTQEGTTQVERFSVILAGKPKLNKDPRQALIFLVGVGQKKHTRVAKPLSISIRPVGRMLKLVLCWPI